MRTINLCGLVPVPPPNPLIGPFRISTTHTVDTLKRAKHRSMCYFELFRSMNNMYVRLGHKVLHLAARRWGIFCFPVDSDLRWSVEFGMEIGTEIGMEIRMSILSTFLTDLTDAGILLDKQPHDRLKSERNNTEWWIRDPVLNWSLDVSCSI